LNSSNSTTQLQLSIDGKQIGTTTGSTPSLLFPLHICGSSHSESPGFHGMLDELYIFEKVLSPEEIVHNLSPLFFLSYEFNDTQESEYPNQESDLFSLQCPGEKCEHSLEKSTSSKALQFDGTQSSLRVKKSTIPAAFGQRSFSACFRYKETPAQSQILFEQGNSETGINIFLQGRNLHAGAWDKNPVDWFWLRAAVEPERWTHITFTYDAIGSGRATLYINGKEVGAHRGIHALQLKDNDMALGGVWENTRLSDHIIKEELATRLTGALDRFAISHKILSLDEIQTDYRSCKYNNAVQKNSLPADLQVQLTTSSTTMVYGEPEEYTLTITNLGPEHAHGVMVESPKSEQFESWNWTCDLQKGDGFCKNQGSGDILEEISLEQGASLVFQITGTIKDKLPDSDEAVTLASVHYRHDKEKSNSQASLSTPLERIYD